LFCSSASGSIILPCSYNCSALIPAALEPAVQFYSAVLPILLLFSQWFNYTPLFFPFFCSYSFTLFFLTLILFAKSGSSLTGNIFSISSKSKLSSEGA